MTDALVAHRLRDVLLDRGLASEAIDDLAVLALVAHRPLSDDAPVTVRVGFATSAAAFGELPRLRNATDDELCPRDRERQLRVEWVGPRGR
jgi:hypothetical protein